MSSTDRAPTETISARLTETGRKALEKEASTIGIKRSDAVRVLLVQTLRDRGHKITDPRVDRIEADE